MPLYTISTENSIAVETRGQLANLIMDVHCAITGAPQTFVNVVFSENVPIKAEAKLSILGAVRKGRTAELSMTLQQELIRQIAKHLDVADSEVDLSLFEVPAQWVMEGGEVLPEPGEEALCEWLQKGHAS